MDWLCIHMHNVYDVQSAAPPLVDISINRVHIALVPAQLVVPEHWSFSRAGLVFRNKVKFYCRHSAFTYTADPTYRYCSGTTMAMWTRPNFLCGSILTYPENGEMMDVFCKHFFSSYKHCLLQCCLYLHIATVSTHACPRTLKSTRVRTQRNRQS